MLIRTRRHPSIPVKLIELQPTDILSIRASEHREPAIVLEREGHPLAIPLAEYSTEEAAEAAFTKLSEAILREKVIEAVTLFTMPLDEPAC